VNDAKAMRERAESAIAADANSPVEDATLTLLARVGRDVLTLLDELAGARKLHREEQRRSSGRLEAAVSAMNRDIRGLYEEALRERGL
jgi:hypothetical protein